MSEDRVVTFLSLLTLEGLASSALGLFLGSFSPSVRWPRWLCVKRYVRISLSLSLCVCVWAGWGSIG